MINNPVRGGSWVNYPWVLRSANRLRGVPVNRIVNSGFRVTVGSGPFVVVRGGSWDNHPRNLRSASRGTNGPSNRIDIFGFRIGVQS